MYRSYKFVVSCFVCTGIVLFTLIYFEVYKLSLPVALSILDEPSTFQRIVGLAHDDPALIEVIRQQIQRPTGMPYRLDHPEKTDFSEGQTKCVKNILKEKRDGFFLEVGAFDGEAASNSLYWEREKGWTGILIEPNPEVFHSLLTRKQRRGLRLHAALCFNNTANRITLPFPQFAIHRWQSHHRLLCNGLGWG